VTFIRVVGNGNRMPLYANSLSTESANLKTVIAIGGFVMVLGNIVGGWPSTELFLAVMLTAYNAFFGWQSNFRFLLSCYFVLIPNMLIGLVLTSAWFLFAEPGDLQAEPQLTVWMFATSFVGIGATILSKISRRENYDGKNLD